MPLTGFGRKVLNSELGFFETVKLQSAYFKEDFQVYWERNIDFGNIFNKAINLFTCHGLHIMFLYRIGKMIYSIKIPVVSHILKIIFQIFRFFISTFYGIDLIMSSKVGPGFYIGHFSGIIISGDFGRDCSVGQCVTVGTKGAGHGGDGPVFGDNVYIGAGAKVLGEIKIGSNVRIGANAVVVTDVPDNSLAVGVPARIKPISNKN